MIVDLLFLLFGAGVLAGAGLIMTARNPMVGVLGMLLAFLNASGLFILLGAPFLGLLIIMVYMGAIAVMFLFVVMTVDIDFAALRERWSPYLPAGLLVVAALVAELVMAARSAHLIAAPVGSATPVVPDVVALGHQLFTVYAVPFQMAGLVLLVAMVGAIVLTHRPRAHVRRQDIGAQIARRRDDSLTMTAPQTGKGLGKTVAAHWAPKSVAKTVKE